MDVIRLRTLTEKSILGFGKYSDLTVQDVINIFGSQYLRWCYFNCSMISFSSQVLTTIKIPDEFIIEKPGTNPKKGDELRDIILERMYGFSKFKNKQHKKKVRKAKIIRAMKSDRKTYSKGNMQRLNHGKY